MGFWQFLNESPVIALALVIASYFTIKIVCVCIAGICGAKIDVPGMTVNIGAGKSKDEEDEDDDDGN